MKISNQRTRSLVLLLAGGLLALGCGDDGGTSSSNNNSTAADLDAAIAQVTPPDGSLPLALEDTGVLDPLHETLNDGQIAGVTAAVNQAEIDQGNYAATKAESQAAKDYAAQMVAMHTQAQSDQTSLLMGLGITPAPSQLGTSLMSDAATALKLLQDTEAGSEFDRAYLIAQAKQHLVVLNAINDQLIPQAVSPALRASLETTRAMVKAHLDSATALLGDAGL